MGFMRPIAERMVMYHVETNAGTELVPESVCGPVELTEGGAEMATLGQYIEGTEVYDTERKEGWYARLSAPGYLDCTDWNGPYDTAEQALEAVKEFHGVDGDDDSCPHCGSEDLQDTPDGMHCASCGVNVDEYEAPNGS